MRYVLAVKQPIYGSQGAFLAYQLAQSLLAQGHQISQIFFYQAGVTNGNAFVYPANDEFNLQQAWQAFAEQHQIPLNLCISASQRRGVVEPLSSANGQQMNLASGFVLAGLGEFSQAVLSADRLLTI